VEGQSILAHDDNLIVTGEVFHVSIIILYLTDFNIGAKF
jgi:hypothetical protein